METLFDRLNEAMEYAGFYIDGRFGKYGNDEDCEIDAFVEDFLLKNGATAVRTDIIDAFDSPSYDCYVLSAAWLDAEGLHLETWLLEMC